MSYLRNSPPTGGGLLGDILGAFDDLLVQETSAPPPKIKQVPLASNSNSATGAPSSRRQNPFLAPPEEEPQTVAYTARVHRIGSGSTRGSSSTSSSRDTRRGDPREADQSVARSTIVKSLLRPQQVQSPSPASAPISDRDYADLKNAEPANDYWTNWKGLSGMAAPSTSGSRGSLSVADDFASSRYRSSSRSSAPAAPKAFNRASRQRQQQQQQQQHQSFSVAQSRPSSAGQSPRRRQAASSCSSSSAASSSSDNDSDSDSDTPVGAASALASATSTHGRAARRLAMQKAALAQKAKAEAAAAAAALKSSFNSLNGSTSSAAISTSSANSSNGTPAQPAKQLSAQQLHHRASSWQLPAHLQPVNQQFPQSPAGSSPLRNSAVPSPAAGAAGGKQPLISGYREYTPPLSALSDDVPADSAASSSAASSGSTPRASPGAPVAPGSASASASSPASPATPPLGTVDPNLPPMTPEELAFMQYQQQQYAAAYTAYMMEQQRLYAEMYGLPGTAAATGAKGKKGKKGSSTTDAGKKKKKKSSKKTDGVVATGAAADGDAGETVNQDAQNAESPAITPDAAPAAEAAHPSPETQKPEDTAVSSPQ
ncbi:hypothetical protein HDU90_000518 [Geranomyces variabilis]|nr:hypothetical protein HDU90_000518 [Geranomyces variabilis]